MPDKPKFDNEAVPVDGLSKLAKAAGAEKAENLLIAREHAHARRSASRGASPTSAAAQGAEGYYRMSLGRYEDANKAARAESNFRTGTRRAARRD